MNRRLTAVALGIAIALAGVLALAVPSIADVEQNLGLRWLFGLRGEATSPGDVAVVAIDGPSAQALGLSDRPREWPRELHAAVTRFLADAGARLIVFDVTFDNASPASPGDAAFAAAIADARNVLLTDSVRKDRVALQGADGRDIGTLEVERPVPPSPMLAGAALAHAPFLLPKGARVDAYWTFRAGLGESPTLPVLALRLYAARAFDAFAALLRAEVPGELQPKSAGAAVADDTNAVATAARAALLKDPALRQRLLARIGDASAQEASAGEARLLRALVTLYAADEMTYLNFYGPSRTIDTVPYHRVVEAARSDQASAARRALTDAFRDKVVFVGYVAASASEQDRVRDDYRTVFSLPNGLDVSGVEIAATAFANLLEDRALKPLSMPVQLAIVAVWGLVLGIACRLLRPVQAAAVAVGLALVYALVAYERFAVAALWAPVAVPLAMQLPAALVAGLMLGYRETRREREAIKRAFGFFLPPSVVDQLVRNLGPLSSADRLVRGVCLATDVEKFTTLAETMEPAELGRLMNDYYAQLFEPVERLGGVVDDVVGDAMVAVWAATSLDGKLRDTACQAALEIVDAVERFNRAVPGRPALPTRFGLHSGRMLLGSIGASRHYEYRAVGDIVNTASRIEGLNKLLGTRLLASAETVEGLRRFVTRPLGSFLLVGKTAAVDIVELVGLAADADPGRLRLNAEFAVALDDYRKGRWRDALDRFAEILRAYPDDGPSRFFRDRCDRLLHDQPAEWTPTVRVAAK